MPNEVVTSVLASAGTMLIGVGSAAAGWWFHKPEQNADIAAKWAHTQAQLMEQIDELQKDNAELREKDAKRERAYYRLEASHDRLEKADYKSQKTITKLQHSLDANIHELGESRREGNETKQLLKTLITAIDEAIPLLHQLADVDAQRLNMTVGLARKAFNGNGSSEAH